MIVSKLFLWIYPTSWCGFFKLNSRPLPPLTLRDVSPVWSHVRPLSSPWTPQLSLDVQQCAAGASTDGPQNGLCVIVRDTRVPITEILSKPFSPVFLPGPAPLGLKTGVLWGWRKKDNHPSPLKRKKKLRVL